MSITYLAFAFWLLLSAILTTNFTIKLGLIRITAACSHVPPPLQNLLWFSYFTFSFYLWWLWGSFCAGLTGYYCPPNSWCSFAYYIPACILMILVYRVCRFLIFETYLKKHSQEDFNLLKEFIPLVATFCLGFLAKLLLPTPLPLILGWHNQLFFG